MQILGDYLAAISGIKESDKEHTHRSALEAFLNAILSELAQSHKDFRAIGIIHEPNNDKSEKKGGAPDFLIQQNGLSLGYIENKRVNANLAELISESNANPKAQIAKYLTLSDNLILTDYLRFLRIAKDEKGKIAITQEITICALNEIQSTLKNKSTLESKQKELLDFFSLFFSATPKPIITALEFANALAQRTRLIKDNLIQNRDNQKIEALYNTFATTLYKDLDFVDFCDSFAQTLTYALFLARLNDTQNESLTLRNAPDYIPRSFPLIRAMSEFLKELNDLDSIMWLIKEILTIINHISPAEITLELNKSAQKLEGDYLHKDPYLHFYETFLGQYDPKMKKIRGVYYTPFEVVSFIINAVDLVLKADFGEAKGLGSALENDNITLLDFATGTGTFLLEAFRKALESTPKDSLNYKPKNLLNRFSGFEFLIAPYTIAHLKISQSFKEEFHAPLEDSEKLNILLTNTLYDKSEKDEREAKSNLFVGMYELAQEFLDSQNLKEQRILIITGNPPYSGASANKGLFEDKVKITYGLEPNLANLTSIEQKQIRNYFETCTNEMQTNSNQSNDFKPIKKQFNAIYNKRKLKNERTTKWLKDDYVKFVRFAEAKIESQKQGIIAIITNHGFLDNPTFRGMRWHLLNTFDKIYILDLHGSTKKKESAPDGSADESVFSITVGTCISIFVKTGQKKQGSLAQVYHYDIYGKQNDKYSFLLQNSLDSIQWSKFVPQEPYYLFLPFGNQKAQILAKQYHKGWSVRDIFKVSGGGITTAHDDFVIDSSKEKLLQKFTDFKDLPPSADELHKRFNVNKKQGWDILKGWQNLQGESNLKKYIQKIAYRPFDMHYIFYEKKLVWRWVKNIMQHFLGNKNMGLVFCRQTRASETFQHIFVTSHITESCFISNKTTEINYIAPLYLIESDSQSENFTPEFRAFMDKKYGERFAPEQILGYIYAILYHKDYREKFALFLRIDYPKIPFAKSKEKFLILSKLGRQLIALHLMAHKLESISEPRFANLQNRNEQINKDKVSYNAEQKRLFVNASLYFDNVSAEVWEYKIGGYQVLDKYLDSHKGEIINAPHFEQIITALHKSLELEFKIAEIGIE